MRKPLRWFSSFVINATPRLIATVGRMDASIVYYSGTKGLFTSQSIKLVMKKNRVLTTDASVTFCLKND